MTTKKNKPKSDDIEFSVYEYPRGVPTISLGIDLEDHIDWHTYHDAPSSITIKLTLEDLKVIKVKVDQALKDAKSKTKKKS